MRTILGKLSCAIIRPGILCGLSFCWLVPPTTLQAQNTPGAKIDFGTLLEELTDRERLANFPGDLYTLHQASSYDRRSVAKDKEGWYANNDWDGYIRKENTNGRDEYVLLDTDGPGAITRFWAAGHPNKKAHLRFYIDGQTTPFWEADHTGALIGQNESIGAPLSDRSVDKDTLTINGDAQPGHNLYAPIPFRHHIKITYDKAPGDAGSGFWYNINYRIYKSDVDVESFSQSTPQKYAAQLKQTNERLRNFQAQSPLEAHAPGEKKTSDFLFELAAGEGKTFVLTGAGAIEKILLSLQAASLDTAVKGLWLQVAFDGRQTIDVPAGFFFGCGDQLLTAGDWYSKADMRGNLAAYWVMPYRQGVTVRLSNRSGQKIAGSLRIGSGEFRWTKNSLYFHAAYKEMKDFVTKAQQGQDFNYLTLKGTRGLYVGDILQVRKPLGGWWGEGDEKIYIDGSQFPDHFGTGTEDYYGYAWGHPETFNHIFNTQPIGDANLNDRGGVTVDSRKRSLDAIPFARSLVFDMESWNWADTRVNFAWTCFYYEKP